MSDNKSSDYGRLQTDPLFAALTRPTMMAGVTYSWFFLEGFSWAIAFINTSSFSLVVPGFIFTHLLGYLLCSHEPRFLEIMMIISKTNFKCQNKQFHGNVNSYDLY